MKLTLEQFINLIYSEKVIYFYEDKPTDYDDNEGRYDFSGIEVFLAYYSANQSCYMLLPEVCERTIAQIYFDDDVIRVVLDDRAEHQSCKSCKHYTPDPNYRDGNMGNCRYLEKIWEKPFYVNEARTECEHFQAAGGETE